MPQESTVDETRHTSLVSAHLYLVRRAARRVANQTGTPLDKEELYAFGCVGLVLAARRFRADRGVLFRTYAYRRIYGEIIEGISKFAPIPRKQYRRVSKSADAPPTFIQSLDNHQLERIEGTSSKQTDDLAKKRRSDILFAALAELPSRSRVLLFQHYFTETPLADVSASLGHSRSWGSRAHRDALETLRITLADKQDQMVAA